MSSTSELRVRYAETDQMGVAYHANYLVWCEIGRTDFIRRQGLSYAQMERDGMRLAVAEANVRFHAPARYDDLVRVETTLTDVRSRALRFAYLLTNADTRTRLASAWTTLVFLDHAGRLSPIPPSVRSALSGVRP